MAQSTAGTRGAAAVIVVLGTKTKVDTVNSALRSVVRQHRQRQMVERAAQDGTYASLPTGDDAWR